MHRKVFSCYVNAALCCLGFLFLASPAGAEAIIADHNAVGEFGDVPDSVIQSLGEDYLIFYGHTSHGSQIVTGIDLLYDEDPFCDPPTFQEYGDDLGGNEDTTWVPPTRAWLNAHPEYNMVMWSWCGGCSDNTEQGINIYLNAVSGLEQDYPGVTFIYMTGHLDGTGPEGNLYARNNQIRDYCLANDKILFDFADIESYDPNGNYYSDASDACEWCYDWCLLYPCPSCGCAHSHCFNCYLKGKAWWWMMARIWGWGAEQDSVPRVVSTSPEEGESNVPVTTDISVTFSVDVDETTMTDTTFVVNADSTGLHQGPIVYSSPTKTATFNPDADFGPGEEVDVVLTTGIQSWAGIPLDSSYSWSFITMVDRGDCNDDGIIDLADVVYLLNYLYKNGSAPEPLRVGDVNCDGIVDLADVVYLINYLFRNGPPPGCYRPGRATAPAPRTSPRTIQENSPFSPLGKRLG